MMSDKEKQLLDNILAVMKGFKEIADEAVEADENLEPYNGDNSELCYHIHCLQNWVLSNAAYRENPKLYRPFGAKFKTGQALSEDN